MSTRAADQDEYAAAAEKLLAEDTPDNAQDLGALGHTLLGEFNQAEIARRETENRWLQDLRQYRGKYDPDVEAKIGKGRSKAFVRKTRVKVKTTDSRVADLLFPAGTEKNWDIGPTPKPSLSPDQKQEIRTLLMQQLQAQAQAQAAQQQGQATPGAPGAPAAPGAAPGAAPAQAQKITRSMFDQAVMEWAKTRSKAMSKTIDDQLTEARYKQTCLQAIHSGNLYGTGIIKGPLIERKVRTRFIRSAEGKWIPQSESYVVPFIDYVPLWRFYPDMAATELKNCRYVYERHLFGKSEMSDLAQRKSFKSDVIIAYVTAHPKGEVQMRHADTELRLIGDRHSSMSDVGGKYEVLERWGWLDGQQLRDAGVEVPDERVHESFFSNLWLLPNGEIIKAVLQPINGVTWPYHIYYFDKDEASIFGEGLAAVMRDDQMQLNASRRLLLDNAAITSGPQMEVNPHLLTTFDKVDEFNPWKVWLRNNTSPGVPAVRVLELPSRMGELSQMAEMFENSADEVSAIPRYINDGAGPGAAATAAGLSMQMGNVNIVIKDLITSWDEGVTRSFIQGLYYWNMQFNSDDLIKGDFDVKARGTSSLVAKEVRAQALNQFAAMTANPMDAPYIKRDVLNRQRAEANELTDVVKTEEEVAAEQNSQAAQQQAQLQQQAQQLQLQEAQAKVAKLLADADLAKTRTQEMLANIEVLVAKAVNLKVEAAYAALQAGGVATSSPHIAPAGDEILRSSGWKDATPSPSIAQLDGPPVQSAYGTSQVLNKGQSFAVAPTSDTPQGVDPAAAVDAQANPDASRSEPAAAGTTAPQAVAKPQIATGMVGREHGIETTRID